MPKSFEYLLEQTYSERNGKEKKNEHPNEGDKFLYKVSGGHGCDCLMITNLGKLES